MNCLRKCMVCTPKALGLEDEYELCDYLQDFLPVRQWSPLNATEQIEGLGDPRKSKKKSEHSVLTWSSLAIECQCLWKLRNSSLCVLAEFTLALLVTLRLLRHLKMLFWGFPVCAGMRWQPGLLAFAGCLRMAWIIKAKRRCLGNKEAQFVALLSHLQISLRISRRCTR